MVRELADELLPRGHHATLITSHPGWPRRSTEDGLDIVRHWRPPPERWLRRHGFLEYLTHIPLSYASLRKGDYDVVQALDATDGLVAARWSRDTGRPSILAYVGIADRDGLTDRRLRLEVTQAAARGSSVVTVLSRAAAESFRRWLNVDARVIAPPVNTAVFSPGGERAEHPTIVCPAAIEEPRKRVPLLIRAFAQVRRRLPGARLVLSRPRRRGAWERLVQAEPGIELADLDSRAGLVASYRAAWLVALPSVGEAFGLVLAEALACGTPVVGTDSGAIPEIVNGSGIGRLFAPDDEHELARALLESLELANDPATATRCRTRAEGFSAARCADAYEDLYRELLA
jgi:glycosyltransferase involved in cell wall biosynthesis